MTVQRLTAEEAVALIADGDTVAISGGGYRVAPEELLVALEARARDGRGPRGLTAIAIAMIERGRGGRGGAATGLNHLAVPGMVSRVISGSYSRARESELSDAIHAGAIEAFNYPMGTIVQWLRASAAGRPALLTQVGIGTFIDPRLEGGVVNGPRENALCSLVDVAGETYLRYPALEVDIALVKASAADERGNLYLDREAFDHGIQDMAMAARRARGRVIAQVNRIVAVGDLHPRFGRVPGVMVDAVVVSPDAWEDEQDPVLTGDDHSQLPAVSSRREPRDVIADLAVDRIATGSMVNLGAGIPMYDVPEAARRRGRDDLYFTVEQGPMGGWPQVGGVSRHPEMIWPQLDVFDFYEGGGPDVSVLSFGQVGASGDVNVSRFAGMMPGCGGFPNIVHGARRLIFCGTLTTGGLDSSVADGRLIVTSDGRIDRFVETVEQITFSADRARAIGQTVKIVTERAVFELDDSGLLLTDIAPGIELERHVLERIPFPVRVAPDLKTLPSRFYR